MGKREKNLFRISIIALWSIGIGILCMILSGNSNQNCLIGASYMTMNNEFYKIMSEEISQRVEAEGDQMILRDPALSVERQIEQINEMLDMGIKVLVLTPVDWESLTDVLNRAKSLGVYIVVVDSNVKEEELVDCTITSDNYAAGHMIGEYMAEHEKKGRVVLFVQKSARSGMDRIQGFLDAVKGKKNIEIVDQIECEGQLEIAMPKMREVIEQKTGFDQVFCINDLASVGVVAALDEKGLLDQISVYGIDASPDSKALIKEGMMRATAAQFPSKIGKVAADNIYRLLNGKKVRKHTNIPLQLVDQENVGTYGVDRWQ